MKRFAMLGAAGFVAPRHLKAIHQTGHGLVAACDPYDGVGILDRFFPSCRFFTEFERFDRHLEKLRRRGTDDAVDYLSICSPNYLHDAHCRLALRVRAAAICEKPLVISPWNLDQLEQIETEYGGSIYTVLQLRLHPEAQRLKAAISQAGDERIQCKLEYVTRRGAWYDQSWKGQANKSGGLAMNIGIHFFDLLIWLFGPVQRASVTVREDRRLRGRLELSRADVSWNLSIELADLPDGHLAQGLHAHRALKIGEDKFDFSSGFDDLHTRVYEDILSGGGYRIEDARPSIELVHHLRTANLGESRAPVTS
ncbi:MAG: Gfo/Idh/MocA family oxidoreductase [Myxococcota bacterium]|nr:Gfo/Idh/MocA family oxidoreductase [Myxococcota bacterium]